MNYGYSGGIELTEELIRSLSREAERGYRKEDLTLRFPKELDLRMVRCINCNHLAYLNIEKNRVNCLFCKKGK